MSSTYKIDLNKIRQENMKEVFVLLEKSLSELKIDFYLIGAIARDVWISGVHKMTANRTTRDLDLAVLVSAEEEYKQLKEYLVNTGRFVPSRENQYVLIFEEGIEVDLLPFGGLEIEGLKLPNSLALTTNITGFTEVFTEATQLMEIEGLPFKVCTLPGIVVLKLIAYDDRPEMRRKDLVDIGDILLKYDSIAGDELYSEKHYDLLELENTLVISARLMGRQLKPILEKSEPLKERIVSILINNRLTPHDCHINQANYRNVTDEESTIDLLKELLTGLTHDH
ncbi:nucleotidyl transferase AbiEii/AbiGii toxin family protein [Solitalea lacus]|uniref:nucleotidyl transferase AbiEii/AbiGii toxin family protein n=1 Tax=Solitalea lacus TaxID=2911172 RepID=UPI001EDB958A|nr:nucleotidyl transferase AbiEii/AbiGii toxin family protein [Solitalea lacus]UKJ09138.1 nucleotidyl transferase AbiEii/AbiGii toxin family protein [Solitalea lacus]